MNGNCCACGVSTGGGERGVTTGLCVDVDLDFWAASMHFKHDVKRAVHKHGVGDGSLVVEAEFLQAVISSSPGNGLKWYWTGMSLLTLRGKDGVDFDRVPVV